MTRPIEFRAWDGKEWYFPMYVAGGWIGRWRTGEPDHPIVEFTGLYDKNGKKIFEGDILVLPDSEIVPITDEGQGPEEIMNHLSPVEFSKGSFGLSILETSGTFRKGFWSFDSIENGEGYKVSELEIIGNIWEHPELIK